MGCCNELEIALKRRFEAAYARSMQPVMLEIESQVCGCSYGASSWTTREQADTLIGLLALNTGTALIDLGAGTGWPGLFLADNSGCAVTLVDLPEIGLRIAAERALADGLADRVSTCVGDAADLPFEDASFDAINHSDLLCCLVSKREVLLECRRIIRSHGKMAFTVISIAPGLNKTQFAHALANAPDFVEAECDYQTLLQQTGWLKEERIDLTENYRRSCALQVDADSGYLVELVELLGLAGVEERQASWKSKLSAIQDGMFLRELFICRPN